MYFRFWAASSVHFRAEVNKRLRVFAVQCIGVAGEVQGVLEETGTVIVKYAGFDKKWNINPELLHKTVSDCEHKI